MEKEFFTVHADEDPQVEVRTYLDRLCLPFQREERVDEVASDIATTLIKLRALQENMNPLLQAVLNRLQHVESWIVPRLLLVYVHVMNSQFDAFIDFLSTAPDFGERSALSFVICDGFCKQFGKFQRRERKLVTLVLSKILVHAVGHPNFQLHGMTFEGEQLC